MAICLGRTPDQTSNAKLEHSSKSHIQKCRLNVLFRSECECMHIAFVFLYAHPLLWAAVTHPAHFTISWPGIHESAGIIHHLLGLTPPGSEFITLPETTESRNTDEGSLFG